MQRTVARLNIERFARMLESETDAATHAMLARLLVEEVTRLACLARTENPGGR